MTAPGNSDPNAGSEARRSGRYRYRGGSPLDPNEGVHPEMHEDALSPERSEAVPSSPSELIAMQENSRPQKPERQQSAKVKQALDLIDSLETTAAEDQQIALAILRHLEAYHDEVVQEMQDDETAKHSQIVCWAVDADRLMRSRLLLESVDLE